MLYLLFSRSGAGTPAPELCFVQSVFRLPGNPYVITLRCSFYGLQSTDQLLQP